MLYGYECEHGHQTHVLCRVDERTATVPCDVCGRVATRFYRIHVPAPGAYPYLSDALGVAHDQVAEAHAESVRLGVPTEFTDDGRAVIRDRHHRKRLCEELGFFDRDAGYGDAQPTQRGLEVLGNLEADGELKEDEYDYGEIEDERCGQPVFVED